jgi:ubiquinone/menaquinone biosynthesis C-methylase UbiE
MRILDLGCGTGLSVTKVGLKLGPVDSVVGVDIDKRGLSAARKDYPARQFICARGEALPLPSCSSDFVLCNVALPYMNIRGALREVSRVLVPGGRIYLKVHPLSFAIHELATCLPRPVPSLFRLYVIANGIVFHATGRTAALSRSRTESFQTRRGMRIALTRAQFEDIQFSQPDGRLIVEARKIGGARL